MKRAITTILAAILGIAAYAYTPGVHDVDINVLLLDDGTACVSETWDVTVDHGTEWYLVRENLGDISIYDFEVRENGRVFVNEGSWDVERSLGEKADRCGIVRKSDGCELCWGLGSYGDHIFKVSYKMSNAAKSLSDYDMFHVQLVSDQLSSAPDHVKATIRVSGKELSTDIVRMWGFGFYGDSSIEDGAVVYESSEPFSSSSSLIALIRFDKGIMNPTSEKSGNFEKVLEKAFKGSAYKAAKKSNFWGKVFEFIYNIGWILLAILFTGGGVKFKRKITKEIIGTKKKSEVMWSREIPYGGDLASTDYILDRLGEKRKGNYIASAMILRMIQKGCLAVRKDANGKTEITFGDESAIAEFGNAEKKLWSFMKEASGEDQVLQDKEFSRWSKRHTSAINGWLSSVTSQGKSNIISMGYSAGSGRYTAEGQAEARKALGLKKFLSDYTLIKERASQEVVLWQEYLVYGAMFGIADKVASELKDINPTMFEEATLYDYGTTRNVIYMSTQLANSITYAKSQYDAAHSVSSGSVSGFGGHTSFGGGGGFSGGGHGGGCR